MTVYVITRHEVYCDRCGTLCYEKTTAEAEAVRQAHVCQPVEASNLTQEEVGG